MILGGRVAWATPGGPATDLVILASSLLALAGLLFLAYVVAVLASIAYGVIRGPLPQEAPAAAADESVVSSTGTTAVPGADRVSTVEAEEASR